MGGEQQGVLHQVGGHGAHDKAQAMQVSGEGLVLKPIQDGARGLREADFYKNISSSSDPSIALFYQFVPQFFGISRKVQDDGSKAEFLMMENLTQSFSPSCIMDVKIGARTWGPDSSPEKQASQDASYSGTKKPFGFSVPGLAVYRGSEIKDGEKPEQVLHGKDFGRSLSVQTIHSLLPLFLAQDIRSNAAKGWQRSSLKNCKKSKPCSRYKQCFTYMAAACSLSMTPLHAQARMMFWKDQ